ncbi:hypothetical protein [Phenylobacterium sp.]|uniref:hypothetical protein n=1 Tax=Phenylobacterium sp. TaxID=1871053 RepID=UPI0025DB3C0E|nr:hypothetical protein [Phenylobacterium sp.]
MDTKAAAITPAPESAKAQLQPVAPAKSEPPAGKGQDTVETRLVIEQDQASGIFIYKTINRLTGEVVQQLPRDEVLRLKDAGQYEAGSVVRTKA